MSDGAVAKTKWSQPGDDTKDKILYGVLEGLRTVGITGISARTLAKIGDFNQALIYYHFGSIDEAMIIAVTKLAEERRESHRARLQGATTLTELIAIARELHDEDTQTGAMRIFVQSFAGANPDRDPLLGPRLHQAMDGWNDLVGEAVENVLGDKFSDVVDNRSLARIISTLFVGIELLDSLDPDAASAGEVFDSLTPLATLLDTLLASPFADTLPAMLENPEMFTPPTSGSSEG